MDEYIKSVNNADEHLNEMRNLQENNINNKIESISKELQESKEKFYRLKQDKYRKKLIIKVTGASITALALLFTYFLTNWSNQNIQKAKNKNDLIIELVRNKDAEERIKNINFFINVGLLEDNDYKIRDAIKESKNIPYVIIGTDENPKTTIYKISNKESIIGYLKLPLEIDMFTLYLVDNSALKEGSTVIMKDVDGNELIMVERGLFIKNLGSYINTANISNKKLIISAHSEKARWLATNMIKFGKSPDKLDFLKRIKMWHPFDNKVYEIQGWINYP
jgi:hypothetical protein